MRIVETPFNTRTVDGLILLDENLFKKYTRVVEKLNKNNNIEYGTYELIVSINFKN